VAAVRRLVSEGLDWERLLFLATHRHKLVPLLYWHVNAHASGEVPEAFLAELRSAFKRNTAAVLRLTGELIQVLKVFEANGILAVPYKGPVLALELYGNLALRRAGDLDILVSRRDVERARELLLERGYAPRHELDAARMEFLLDSRYGEELHSPDGTRIELHWRFSNLDTAFPVELDMLLPALRQTRVSGATVPAFGWDDLLIILSVHGAKHRWDSLELVCGMAELLRKTPPTDWALVLERARELGSRRVLLLALTLAHDLLDAPLAPSVRKEIEADRRVASLSRHVMDVIMDERIKAGTLRSVSGDLFRLHLRDTLGGRIRFVFYRLTTPSNPDNWSFVRWGRRSVPIHGLARPFRVVGKLIGATSEQAKRP
jgi:hypothetical protein